MDKRIDLIGIYSIFFKFRKFFKCLELFGKFPKRGLGNIKISSKISTKNIQSNSYRNLGNFRNSPNAWKSEEFPKFLFSSKVYLLSGHEKP